MRSSSKSDSPKVHHVPIFVESSGATIRPRHQNRTDKQSQSYRHRVEDDHHVNGANSSANSHSRQPNESSCRSHNQTPLPETPQEPLPPPSPHTPIPLSLPPGLQESKSQNTNSNEYDNEKDVIPSVIPLPGPEPKKEPVKPKPKSIPLPPPPEHSSFARPSQRSNVSGSHINIPEPGFSSFETPPPPRKDPVPEPAPLWTTKVEVKGGPRQEASRCWVSHGELEAPVISKNIKSNDNPKANMATNIEISSSGNRSNDNQDVREKEKENMNVILAVEKIKLEVDGLVNQIHSYTGVSCEERDYRIIDEMLTRCMLKLDKVDCLNQDRLRQTRKLAIKQVNDAITLLEAKVQSNAARLKL